MRKTNQKGGPRKKDPKEYNQGKVLGKSPGELPTKRKKKSLPGEKIRTLIADEPTRKKSF